MVHNVKIMPGEQCITYMSCLINVCERAKYRIYLSYKRREIVESHNPQKNPQERNPAHRRRLEN